MVSRRPRGDRRYERGSTLSSPSHTTVLNATPGLSTAPED
jgi:hypothetical protein